LKLMESGVKPPLPSPLLENALLSQ